MRSLVPFLILAEALAFPVDLSQVPAGALGSTPDIASGGPDLPSTISAAAQVAAPALGVAASLCAAVSLTNPIDGLPLTGGGPLTLGSACPGALQSVGRVAAGMPPTSGELPGADPGGVASGIPRLNAARPQNGAPQTGSDPSNGSQAAPPSNAQSSAPPSAASPAPTSNSGKPQKSNQHSAGPQQKSPPPQQVKPSTNAKPSSKSAAQPKSTKAATQQKAATRPSPSPSPAPQSSSPPPPPPPSPSSSPQDTSATSSNAGTPSDSNTVPSEDPDCPLDCLLKLADQIADANPTSGPSDLADGLNAPNAIPGVIHLGTFPGFGDTDPTEIVDPASSMLPVDPVDQIPDGAGLPISFPQGVPPAIPAGGLESAPASVGNVPAIANGVIPGDEVPCDDAPALSISVAVNGQGQTGCESCEEKEEGA